MGCGLGLIPGQRYRLELHHFDFIPLLEAVPQVKRRSARKGDTHINLYCEQEFQILEGFERNMGPWGPRRRRNQQTVLTS